MKKENLQNSLDCNKVKELIIRTNFDTLTETEISQIQRHCARCASCQGYADNLHKFNYLIEKSKNNTITVNPYIKEAVSQRMEELKIGYYEQPPGILRFFKNNMKPIYALAALFLVVFIGGYFYGMKKNQQANIIIISASPKSQNLLRELEKIDGQYTLVKLELLSLVNSQSSELSPQAVKTIKENLKRIEASTQMIKNALVKDINNRQLLQQYFYTINQQMDFLNETTAFLTSKQRNEL